MSDASSTTVRPVPTVLLAWLLSLGFDFFLHGGVLAELYDDGGPFLLPPETAFARIPLGYLGFLLLTAALFWLLRRLGVRGWLDGFRLSAAAGLVVWGSLCLGLVSITTARWELLVGWWVGQSFEVALAGAVIGAALGGRSLKALTLKVGAAWILLVTATVVYQSGAGWTSR